MAKKVKEPTMGKVHWRRYKYTIIYGTLAVLFYGTLAVILIHFLIKWW